MGHAQCESLGLDKGLLYEKKSFKRAGFVHGNEMKGKYVIYVSKAVIKNMCNSKVKWKGFSL